MPISGQRDSNDLEAMLSAAGGRQLAPWMSHRGHWSTLYVTFMAWAGLLASWRGQGRGYGQDG
jgi:hypothetical protein